MKRAKDFRQKAREVLKGKWGIAVLAGLLASLLCGTTSSGVNFDFNINTSDIQSIDVEQLIQNLIPQPFRGVLVGGVLAVLAIGLVFAAVYYVIGSVVGVGYAQFNLDLHDQNNPAIGTMFSRFSMWKTTAVTRLLRDVYVLLWSLLLIIPGIVASYSYSMAEFILAENPGLKPKEALARSKELMHGNKWRLYCLHLSFIGWALLSLLTLGIGVLWLVPYQQASVAAFYRDIAQKGAPVQIEEPWENF